VNDHWTIAKLTADSGEGLFRYIDSKPHMWDSLPLSEEVSISWNYDGAQPNDATRMRMDTLEDALADLCFGDELCLALVMTVGGLREWCFYTRDYGTFMETLNMCLTAHERFPITIEHSHDHEWRYWHSFVDRLIEAR